MAKKKVYGCFAPKRTAEEVAAAVEELINEYRENGDMPTDYRLAEKTGVSTRTVDRWYTGEKDSEEDTADESAMTYKESMQRLINFRRQLCIENIAGGASNKVTGWIFLSKQPRWGGFQDSVQRTETSGKQDIKITIAGADGKPLKNAK